MLYILVRIGKYWSAVALVASIALLVISHHFTMDWSTGKIPGVKRGGSLQVTKRGYMITWDARAPLDFGFMGYPAKPEYDDADFDGPFRTGQTRSGFRRWGFMYADYLLEAADLDALLASDCLDCSEHSPSLSAVACSNARRVNARHSRSDKRLCNKKMHRSGGRPALCFRKPIATAR